MILFLARRLTSSAATLFCLATLTFFLMRLAPGGPFDEERAWPPEIKENIDRKYGLDLPLHRQFTHWMNGVVHGDLNESFQYLGRPVSEMISSTLPVSAILGFWALLIAILIGVPLGALAAWNRKKAWDHFALFLSISGISLPGFLLASILILVFSLTLNWLPPALWEGPESAILPILTLSFRPMAMLIRMTRASVLETLHSDYIRTARAKGLSETRVLFKHALRNSLVPVITLAGPLVASLITGSFIVELIFQIPGMGKYFVSGILNRDYPLAMGMTLTYGVILLSCNLLVDLSCGWMDPRMRNAK